MTPEQQRYAIAEACGFVWYRLPQIRGETRVYRGLFLPAIHEYEGQDPRWLVRADGSEGICSENYLKREGLVPDYLNDLNAIHEAEQILGKFQKDDYVQNLLLSFHGQNWHFYAIHATAAQRAEAFLRTIGKWKD